MPPPQVTFLAENWASLFHVLSSPSVSLSRLHSPSSLSSSSVVCLLVSVSVWSPLWSPCTNPSAPPSGSAVPSSVATNGLSPLVSSYPTFSTTRRRIDPTTHRIASPSLSSLSGLQFSLVAWSSFPRCALSCPINICVTSI